MLFLRVMCAGMQMFFFVLSHESPFRHAFFCYISCHHSVSVVQKCCAIMCLLGLTFNQLSRVELRGGYHEYTEVRSCQDVVHLYHLLWSATILNIIALFLGIITAAVLGGFKDMVRSKCTGETVQKISHFLKYATLLF